MSSLIDLTPNNPYSLVLRAPVLAQAPALLRVMQRLCALPGIGGILTPPIGAERRAGPEIQEVPAGVLLGRESWPASSALRQVRQWTNLDRPVLALLDEDDPRQLAALALDLGDESSPAGFVIAAGAAAPALVAERIAAVRAVTPLPLLVGLAVQAEATAQAHAAEAAGVEALLISDGPGGAAYAGERLMYGRLDGPSAEPPVLALAAALRQELPGLALIAPAARLEGAAALLSAGAVAILLRAGLWRDPDLAQRIAELATP